MLVINKKFDKALHDEHDDIGRTIVKNYFKSRLNFEVIDNPDIYGVDLIIYRDAKKVGFAEVEVRTNWNTNNFPFSTLNVPLRKKKLLQNELPTYFFSINHIHTRMFCCDADVVLNCSIEENKNKFVKNNEYFYKVPIDKLKLIIL